MHSGTKGGGAWSGGLGIRSVKVGGCFASGLDQATLICHLRILWSCPFLPFLTASVKMRMLDVSEVAKIQKKPSPEEVCHILLSHYFSANALPRGNPNCVELFLGKKKGNNNPIKAYHSWRAGGGCDGWKEYESRSF